MDAPVAAGGGQQVTAQAERDAVQAAAAPGDEGAGQVAADQVPEVGPAVGVGGGQQFVVGIERDTDDAPAAGMSEGRGEPARHVPQVGEPVAVGGGQHVTV